MKLKSSLKRTYLIKKTRIFYNKMKIRAKQDRIIQQSIEWRDLNRHNFTSVGNNGINDNAFPMDLVKVGKGTYGLLHVTSYGVGDEFLSIGDYCSIAQGVKFILGGEHALDTITTYPFERIYVDNESIETFSTKGKIIMENDVWIGSDALILSGVKLSQGTVVAAGSVVTKSSEPYSVIGGNPAKLIKKRFPEHIISQLLCINISNLDTEFIKSNIDVLKLKVDDSTIDIINNRLADYINK